MTSFYVKEIKEISTTKDGVESLIYKYKFETKDKLVQISVSSSNDLNLFQGSFADLKINEVDF